MEWNIISMDIEIQDHDTDSKVWFNEASSCEVGGNDQ